MSHVATEVPIAPISRSSPISIISSPMSWPIGKVPGVAIAVVQDGKVTLTRADGQRDVEADLPVTPATQFVICSITKSFTATAIALLHHEGRLDWTKPVRDYTPEFRLNDAVATERVTVRDLPCHQSGLPRHDWVQFAGDRASSEMLGVMRHLELSRDIRAARQYTTSATTSRVCSSNASADKVSRRSSALRPTDRLGMTVGFSLDDLEASDEAARPYMMHEEQGCQPCVCRSAPPRPARSTPRSPTSRTGCGCIWVRARSTASVCCRHAIGELHAPAS